MFPYGMGWPGYCLPSAPTSISDIHSMNTAVDWASRARQWREQNLAQIVNITSHVGHSFPNDASSPANPIWNPLVPPPNMYSNATTPSYRMPGYHPPQPFHPTIHQQLTPCQQSRHMHFEAPPPPPPSPPKFQQFLPDHGPMSLFSQSNLCSQTESAPSSAIFENHMMVPPQSSLSTSDRSSYPLDVTLPGPLLDNHQLHALHKPLLPTPLELKFDSPNFDGPGDYFSQLTTPESAFIKPNVSYATEQDIINDLKKKRLPAWIREGLEKIEQEKNKKIVERQTSAVEKEPCEQPRSDSDLRHTLDDDSFKLSEIESASDSECSRTAAMDVVEIEKRSEKLTIDENRSILAAVSAQRLKLSPDTRSELKVCMLRRLMTNLLLSTTNDELLAIVKREVKRLKQNPDCQPTQVATSAALSYLANEVSSSEFNDDSHSSRSSPSIFDDNPRRSIHSPLIDCKKVKSRSTSRGKSQRKTDSTDNKLRCMDENQTSIKRKCKDGVMHSSLSQHHSRALRKTTPATHRSADNGSDGKGDKRNKRCRIKSTSHSSSTTDDGVRHRKRLRRASSRKSNLTSRKRSQVQ